MGRKARPGSTGNERGAQGRGAGSGRVVDGKYDDSSMVFLVGRLEGSKAGSAAEVGWLTA